MHACIVMVSIAKYRYACNRNSMSLYMPDCFQSYVQIDGAVGGGGECC